MGTGVGICRGKSQKCYERELDNTQKRHSFRSIPVIHSCIKKCKQNPQVILKFLLIAGYYCHFCHDPAQTLDHTDHEIERVFIIIIIKH